MKIRLSQARLLCVLGALGVGVPQFAEAGAVITYGNTSLGVNDEGHLNFGSDTGPAVGSFTYGVYRAGLGDAISPGCLCEGWGVSATFDGLASSTWASLDNGGMGNIAGGSFGATFNTATSEVLSSTLPMTIRHAFGPSLATDLFQVQVTITNTGAQALNDLVYRRTMDWDIPPTEFYEYVSHSGVQANLVANGGNLAYASDNGFANSDPLSDAGWINAETLNVDFYRNGPTDHGSVFDFSFGTLAPGASRIFNIYYGTAANEADARSKVAQVGATLFSLGQSGPANSGEGGGGEEVPSVAALVEDGEGGGGVADTGSVNPTTFIFAFGGVSGVEPGTIPEVPVLPFVPAPGQFTFDAPEPRRWYDPPSADGFTYILEGGEFHAVGAPPGSFGFGVVKVFIDGVEVAELAPGEVFDFDAHGYDDVTQFDLRGISPLVDPSNPMAFPTYLDFDDSATSLRMIAIAAVPEPRLWAMLCLGLLLVLSASRRQAQQRQRA